MYLGAWLWQLLSVLALARASDWGDWIIVDEAEAGTSVLLRRITPKSVFVAPTFGCSEGYRQDSLGRCVKHVKVNQAEQWKFYLERLNSMYAPASNSKKPQKEAGPFHISLPLGSDNSQSDVVVKKRLPPAASTIQSTTSTTSATTTAKTTTTTAPPPSSTVQESTTQEATQPTMVDLSEATSTEKELNSETVITTETRRKYETTEADSAVMLGDAPVGTENPSVVAKLETPKNNVKSSSQLPEKPFVIIVTNEPTTRAEETTFLPPSFTPPVTERDEEETTSEASTTTEVTMEGTTETTMKYTTDPNTRPTEYDERFSETKDIAETSIRPNGRFTSTSTLRPKCDTKSDIYGSSDCDPAETEFISHKRVVTNPSVSLPSSLPLLEPNTQVRFPSESFIPPRKPQTFVRFPESTHPHDDRPGLFWPSWHVPKHPGIRGWPPPDDPPLGQMIHKQFPTFPHHQPHPHPHPHPGQTWSDSNAWRRRFFQRD